MGTQPVTHSSALSEWGSRGRGKQEEMVFDRSLVLAVERRVTERVVLLLVFFAFRRVTNYLFFLFSHPWEAHTDPFHKGQSITGELGTLKLTLRTNPFRPSPALTEAWTSGPWLCFWLFNQWASTLGLTAHQEAEARTLKAGWGDSRRRISGPYISAVAMWDPQPSKLCHWFLSVSEINISFF